MTVTSLQPAGAPANAPAYPNNPVLVLAELRQRELDAAFACDAATEAAATEKERGDAERAADGHYRAADDLLHLAASQSVTSTRDAIVMAALMREAAERAPVAPDALPGDVALMRALCVGTDALAAHLVAGVDMASLPATVVEQLGFAAADHQQRWGHLPPTPFRFAVEADAAASARFNALPSRLEMADDAAYAREEAVMNGAWASLEAARPETWAEFAEWCEMVGEGGESVPRDEIVLRLLGHVRRLGGRSPSAETVS